MIPKSIILLVSVCSLVSAFGCSAVPISLRATGEPQALPPNEIPAVLSRIPSYTRFGYSGLAFYKGRLYATTNVGLIEFENAKPSKLYKWHDSDDVLSGPWLDVADDALWAMHDGLQKLIRFDGTTWRLIDLPTPRNGYTRGDLLRGFDGIGTKDGFWFVGGGHAWRWNNSTGSWGDDLLPGDTLDKGLSALDRELIAIASTERIERFRVEQSVNANDQGYVCTDDGQIFKITNKGTVRLDSPGECEAIAISASGLPVASFRGMGLFEFDDGWRKKFESPYGPNANEQWADLAVAGTQYAFSITGKPHGYGENKTYPSTTRLWVSVNGQLVPVAPDDE